jgi:hypothetical protein
LTFIYYYVICLFCVVFHLQNQSSLSLLDYNNFCISGDKFKQNNKINVKIENKLEIMNNQGRKKRRILRRKRLHNIRFVKKHNRMYAELFKNNLSALMMTNEDRAFMSKRREKISYNLISRVGQLVSSIEEVEESVAMRESFSMCGYSTRE